MAYAEDWKVNATPGEKVPVPTFIRLFVMKRILRNLCKINDDQVPDSLKAINDKKQRENGILIVTRLLQDGTKKYMEKWFNEKEQVSTIELIFNQVTLTKYAKEYEKTITYGIDDKDNEHEFYQRIVFNTTDLMCSIFQYIPCSGDMKRGLLNCSLVNSHWLYHVWNPNSIYHLSITDIIKKTMMKTDSNAIVPRTVSAWQRLIGIKSIHCYLLQNGGYHDDDDNNNDTNSKLSYLLSKLLTLKNITHIRFTIDDDEQKISMIKAIMSQCSKNIIEYCVKISKKNDYDGKLEENINDDELQYRLPTLQLFNGKDIWIRSLYYFNIIWSYKCKNLYVGNVKNANDKWIQFVIDNCDCNGIEGLHLLNASLSLNKLYQENEKTCRDLVEKFANNFQSLNNFKIMCYDEDMNWYFVLLWRYLHPIIEKNNGKITLQICNRWDSEKFEKLNKMVEETKTGITRLDIWFYIVSSFDSLKALILNPKLEYLGIDNWIKDQGVFKSMIQFLKQSIKDCTSNLKKKEQVMISQKHQDDQDESNIIVFSSLKLMDIDDSNMILKVLIEFLQFIPHIAAIAPGLFVIINCQTDVDGNASLLDTLFTNIRTLLATDQMAIDFKIRLAGQLQQAQQLNDVLNEKYQLIFNLDEILTEYKTPIFNKYCESFNIPKMSIEIKEEEMCNMRFATAKKVNL